MSYREVCELDNEDAHLMWEAITVIEARDSLRWLSIMDYPHQSPSQRRKIHREFSKQAFPSTFATKKKITFEQLGKILSGGNK